MRIELDREKRITLLMCLRQGYIDTADIEKMGDGRLLIEYKRKEATRGIPVGRWLEYESGLRIPRLTDEDIVEAMEINGNDFAEVQRLYMERQRAKEPPQRGKTIQIQHPNTHTREPTNSHRSGNR